MVSVSIVTYHTPLDELDTCLSSINCDMVARIYVIDNSRDKLIEKWAGKRAGVIYIPSDNIGYGAAHNLALRAELDRHDCDYHLVMNSDMKFEPHVISDIHAYMEAHPDIGTLQPIIVSPDGSRQYTCRRLPSPFDVFIRRFIPTGLFKKHREKYLLTDLDYTITQNIPYHQGSFMFLRKEALHQAGLFDERFFMYPEDIDLTRRIHRHYLTVCWPGATIVHNHRAASYHSLRMLVIHAVNMIRYFNKWGWLHDPERVRFNNAIGKTSIDNP